MISRKNRQKHNVFKQFLIQIINNTMFCDDFSYKLSKTQCLLMISRKKTAATHLGSAATHLGTAVTHPGAAATHPGTAATHPGTAKLSKTLCFLMISTTHHQKHQVSKWFLMQIIKQKYDAFLTISHTNYQKHNAFKWFLVHIIKHTMFFKRFLIQIIKHAMCFQWFLIQIVRNTMFLT